MSTSFGYLNKYGYGGHLFPVIIGESGSQYTDVSHLLQKFFHTHTSKPTDPGSCSYCWCGELYCHGACMTHRTKTICCTAQHIFLILALTSDVCGLQSNDIAMMADMAKYLNNQADANDGRHNPIPHLFWWAWNPNSADTGGLVSDPNWDTVPPLFCAFLAHSCPTCMQAQNA